MHIAASVFHEVIDIWLIIFALNFIISMTDAVVNCTSIAWDRVGCFNNPSCYFDTNTYLCRACNETGCNRDNRTCSSIPSYDCYNAYPRCVNYDDEIRWAETVFNFCSFTLVWCYTSSQCRDPTCSDLGQARLLCENRLDCAWSKYNSSCMFKGSILACAWFVFMASWLTFRRGTELFNNPVSLCMQPDRRLCVWLLRPKVPRQEFVVRQMNAIWLMSESWIGETLPCSAYSGFACQSVSNRCVYEETGKRGYNNVGYCRAPG
jgi:hypothetical protein